MSGLFEELSSNWHDRDVQFDVGERYILPRPGEQVIDKFEHIEDTKGNNGQDGQMLITNLRLLWYSINRPSINLSIGHKCITLIQSRISNSRLRGETESLHILAKVNKTAFEFIFTNLTADNPRLFSTVMAVHRSYDTSKLYREVKLRGAIIENNNLKLLPKEQLYDKVNGVMNLCSDTGTLGIMYITNVRVVWHSATNHTFNLSVPYYQLRSVRVRNSNFGVAMVIDTIPANNTAYVLGFRIDPQAKLKTTVQELQNLHEVFGKCPLFGVEYETEVPPSFEETVLPVSHDTPVEDESEVISGIPGKSDAFAAYFADPNKTMDREPVFNSELGLAVEKLPEGLTLKELWEVS